MAHRSHSLPRDQTQAPYIGSVESWPLGHQEVLVVPTRFNSYIWINLYHRRTVNVKKKNCRKNLRTMNTKRIAEEACSFTLHMHSLILNRIKRTLSRNLELFLCKAAPSLLFPIKPICLHPEKLILFLSIEGYHPGVSWYHFSWNLSLQLSQGRMPRSSGDSIYLSLLRKTHSKRILKMTFYIYFNNFKIISEKMYRELTINYI